MNILSTRPLLAICLCASITGCRSTGDGTQTLESPPPSKAAASDSETPGSVADGTPSCIFGQDVEELESSPAFKDSKKHEARLPSRRAGDNRLPKLFVVTNFKHLATGRLYTLYTTFRDEDDGGNTIGWIEAASTGDVVAEINDAEIVACKINGSTTAGKVATGSCLFGSELSDLADTRGFAVKKLPDVTRVSRHDPSEKRPRRFTARELKHLQSGQVYRAYSTAATDKEGQLGWIENQGGQIVALIGEAEIYKCAVNGAGIQVRGLADDSRCGFGTDLHDLEVSDAFQMTKRAEVVRKSRITGDDEREMTFAESQATHVPSGKAFLVFNTFRDEDDGGNTVGWVEAMPGGEVVAEIGDSEFYNCRF